MNQPASPQFQDYSILIVDDTPVNLGVLVAYLESYGFSIRIARNGETALRRVDYDPPDLILLDILMPGLDGFETCRRLKASETGRHIPVIFMTSLTSVEDKVRGFEVGAVDYVVKPLNQDEVLARVSTHLRQRDLTLDLQERHRRQEASSRVERSRLFESVKQQRAQLRALNQKLTEVQEAERKQLARELHDELGQALTAISINLAAVAQALPPAALFGVQEHLDESRGLAEAALEQIRELAFRLRPAILDDLGLEPALRWYMRSCARRTGLAMTLEVAGLERRLPAAVETALYRIVQEALTNVTRHARASCVRLRLGCDGVSASAEIADDGQGFDVAAALGGATGGAGLLGMQERAAILGGSVNIQSAPGAGVLITVMLPLEEWQRRGAEV